MSSTSGVVVSQLVVSLRAMAQRKQRCPSSVLHIHAYEIQCKLSDCLPAGALRETKRGWKRSQNFGGSKVPPSAILRTTAYQYCTKVGQFSSFKKNMYCKYVRTIKSCIATVPGTVSLVPGKQGCLRMCQQVLSCCRFSAGFFSGFLVSKMEITKL